MSFCGSVVDDHQQLLMLLESATEIMRAVVANKADSATAEE